MSLIKGPMNLKWGDNVIQDVESVDFEFETESTDYDTVQGRRITLDSVQSVGVNLTLLSTDLASLALVLPQYFVANGGVLSTGETVNNATGAIDVKAAACDENPVYNNLDIISCGSPADVLRVVNARTRIESVEVDSNVRKIVVRFIGESTIDEATMQMFKQGTINVVS